MSKILCYTEEQVNEIVNQLNALTTKGVQLNQIASINKVLIILQSYREEKSEVAK